MTEKKQENSGFDGLGIAEKLLQAIAKAGLKNPTPIQRESIPVAILGKDLLGVAQTGTGKTLAFAIPMLQRLALYKGRGLVLLPTRELAVQVDESLRKYGAALGLRTAVLIGGENINRQISELRRLPHIIVATPGRLNDHLERHTVKLNDVKILVLDEADMMLDMGFMPQIERILENIPKERQTMLFSATMPTEIIKLANKYMASPLRVEVAASGTTATNIDQEIFIVEKNSKLAQLEILLHEYSGAVLIFCRTKHSVANLTGKISLMGYQATEIHSNRSQIQRRKALDGFRAGRYRVLIATDIAARGIDVSGIELVVNYDLPDDANDYVHRIGRTARAGKSGKAISFADPMQAREIKEIERLVKKVIPLREISPLHAVSFGQKSFGQRRVTGRSFGRSNSSFRSEKKFTRRDNQAERPTRVNKEKKFGPRSSAAPQSRGRSFSRRPASHSSTGWKGF
ncbi:MAG: DEAD/DEAH box helicase [Patescibacteria group bacterium]